MPILKFTSSADTSITNAYKQNMIDRALFSNAGAADSLQFFSISSSLNESEKGRILIKFPVSEISSSRVSGYLPVSGSVKFFLKLFNVEHPETLPTNYEILVKPISGSGDWDEGYGLDLETFKDLGQSGSTGFGTNWIYRNSGSQWVNAGGDFYNNYTKTFHFDKGTEDVSVEVTDVIEAQISGIIPNLGFGIMLSGTYEDCSNNTSYYVKRFSARSSEYFYSRPVIEARWKSVLNDDRGNFYYSTDNLSADDNKQNIYFYNRVNGGLKDLPNSVVPSVKIYNEDGILLTSSIPAYKVSTGVYSASFAITGTVEQTLNDQWFSGSSTFYSGSIEAKRRLFDDSFVKEEYVFALTNLKKSYKSFEKPSIRIFGRQKDWSPNIYSVSYKTINTLTFKNLYYKIFRIVDNKTIIDYGVDPIEYTLCSYDKNGNYFDIDMSFFEPGYAYGIKLLLVNKNTTSEYPQVFRFKVE